jgi:hypothetical protein
MRFSHYFLYHHSGMCVEINGDLALLVPYLYLNNYLFLNVLCGGYFMTVRIREVKSRTASVVESDIIDTKNRIKK